LALPAALDNIRARALYRRNRGECLWTSAMLWLMRLDGAAKEGEADDLAQ
jgi:hypothetical protein